MGDIVATNPQAKKQGYEQVVDLSVFTAIEQAGFIKQVYGR